MGYITIDDDAVMSHNGFKVGRLVNGRGQRVDRLVLAILRRSLAISAVVDDTEALRAWATSPEAVRFAMALLAFRADYTDVTTERMLDAARALVVRSGHEMGATS